MTMRLPSLRPSGARVMLASVLELAPPDGAGERQPLPAVGPQQLPPAVLRPPVSVE